MLMVQMLSVDVGETKSGLKSDSIKTLNPVNYINALRLYLILMILLAPPAKTLQTS